MGGQELLHLLLLEASHIAEHQRTLLLLAEHALLHRKLLINSLRLLVLLQQHLKTFNVEVFGEGLDAEEELVVEEDHSLVVFLNRQGGTTMGARWVFTLAK